MEVKKDILWRVYLCFIGIVVLSVMILGKAVVIQKLQGEHWRSMGDSMHQKIVEINADRGTIFSEDGQMLSTSLPQFDIYMDFKADGLRDKGGKVYNTYIDSFAIAMAGYFKDKTAKEYRAEFDKAYAKGNRYYSLKKKISFEDYKALREFPLIRLGKNKSGIVVEQTSKRIAPFGLLANRTIGLSREYVNSDGKVKKMNVGLEMSYDSLLNGRSGQRLVRYASGGAVPVQGFEVEPEDGRDIYTTLDINMQDVAETALLRMLQSIHAEYGTAIVMETKTGKIKAIANLGRNGEDTTYWENDNYALRVTEPGSTIKIVSFLASLDKGNVKPGDLFEVGSTGRMQVGPRPITDAHRMPKPVLTIEECIAHSSNVGMGRVAMKAFGKEPTEFKEYLDKYHLTKKSPIDLSAIPRPSVAPLEASHGGLMNLVTMAFGYAIQVSPMQLLTLYNAIGNNGVMVSPYLVNSIRNNGVVVKQMQPKVLEQQICKPATLEAAKKALELVITEGSGKGVFKDMPFLVAGKTGTAQVADRGIGYANRIYQASFAGYFPANNPQYSCIVVIRTKAGSGLYYGGQLAAPVFREIATKIYSMYVDRKTPKMYEGAADSTSYFYAGHAAGIKSVLGFLDMKYVDSLQQNNWATMYATNYKRILQTNVVKDNLMPNVRGMGLRDAIRLLEDMGLRVNAKGSGKVAVQSIQPGAPFRKGQSIVLSLA
ncbi:penicillin-binding protein [Niabella yanshanensis]|uniref:Penicillin-binding protein n=1 Tax=Niabella yanshanensis TaxID=577386 RepID=A0ABZ0WA59_9BACT|nr:penicillin-binding protein [Niabella yanshanensis]WQD40173.1 penicillin-binding protein [Niabella yanshanensis]